jgi:hypothetical protein
MGTPDRSVTGHGYALGQLAAAFVTAMTHEGGATRQRAERRLEKWRGVLSGIADGTVTVGSRTLVETAGYVAVPLSENDYIELLPATWWAINAYGVRIGHRTYDSKALNGLRRQHSGVQARKGLWEIHFDPYDVSRIWVRNHHDGGWILAQWTLLKTAPMPFGQQAWEHARQMLVSCA